MGVLFNILKRTKNAFLGGAATLSPRTVAVFWKFDKIVAHENREMSHNFTIIYKGLRHLVSQSFNLAVRFSVLFVRKSNRAEAVPNRDWHLLLNRRDSNTSGLH